MKTLVVVAAGAADRPLEELGGRTPLEAAATPVLDRLVRDGRLGSLTTAPRGTRAEEGAFALALFGLDPLSYGDAGATLDAASYGVSIGPTDLAFRLSLVSADEDSIFDPTGGGISRDEAALLLEALAGDLADPAFSFHVGTGSRNLLVWHGARDVRLETMPPFDVAAKGLKAALPRGAGRAPLLAAIDQAAGILAAHEVNELRQELGENGATLAWVWGPGIRVPLPDFTTRTGAEAHVVGVQPTFLGAARLQGIDVTTPTGATGIAGSNLRGKADAALEALETKDIVFVHVDVPAATALARDFVGKVESLERLDGYVLGPLLRAIEGGVPARLVVIGGEAVGTEAGRYLPEPVPFVVHGPGVRSTRRGAFSEVGARDASFRVEQPHELLDFLLRLPA